MKPMATRNKSVIQICVESLICAGFGILFTSVLVGAYMLSEYING